MGKTLSSHIIHSLGGEYCWIVRDSEPIRLLKSPRSLSVYILICYIRCYVIQQMLYDICYVIQNMLYEIYYIKLYSMYYVLLYNMCDVMLYYMICYTTYVIWDMLCYVI